jgi:phenylacetate-coenzyme A ligase PaaK-like adenylate-forming protein
MRKNITQSEKNTRKIITLDMTEYLVKKGEQRALYILNETAKKVPAYENFLKEKGFSQNDIENAKSITDAPISDKP